MEYDVPTVVDKMMDVLAQRLEASKRQDYIIDIPEGGDQPLQDLLGWARAAAPTYGYCYGRR